MNITDRRLITRLVPPNAPSPSSMAPDAATDGTTASTSSLPSAVLWPAAELAAVVEQLARRSGLTVATPEATSAPPTLPVRLDDAALDRWLDGLAASLALEVEAIQSTYRHAERMVQHAGPALLCIAPRIEGDAPRFVALLTGGRRHVQLIALDGSLRRVPARALTDAIWRNAVHPYAPGVAQMLQRAGVATARRARVAQAIMGEVMGATTLRAGWMLRLPPAASPWRQARDVGLPRLTGTLIGAYAVQLLLTVGAWWMIGRGALSGHFDWGLLTGWALMLFTVVPFQAWTELAQRRLSVQMGVLFKQRLLAGILQFDADEIRHQGAGQFLGRVLASDTVEQIGLAGGFVGILAFLQLGVAALVLAAGVGGLLHVGLLAAWVAFITGLAWLYLRRSRTWIRTYREMTHDLVERMAGHRTRLAQEDRRAWHDDEDRLLGRYLQLQRRLDGVESKLKALAPRGWMMLGMGGLAYAIVGATPAPTAAAIAVSLGGMLLAYQALTTFVLGFKSLVTARLAWQEVGALLHAAGRAEAGHTHMPARIHDAASATASAAPLPWPILRAREITFRYQPDGRPVLHGCNLEIGPGARILLEGPSGGGKSTLVGVLAGLRRPESGLLLLHNVDVRTLGVATWRRHVVAVPQFHENFILTGSLAFNLLMGRRWPPTPADLREANALCDELGLGDLLARMPAGLQQMVGESGWQLSHGERSRVYIARALLQDADVMLLDESFAALDPANLARALTCVLERAPALVVIAHP